MHCLCRNENSVIALEKDINRITGHKHGLLHSNIESTAKDTVQVATV